MATGHKVSVWLPGGGSGRSESQASPKTPGRSNPNARGTWGVAEGLAWRLP